MKVEICVLCVVGDSQFEIVSEKTFICETTFSCDKVGREL